MRWRLLLFSLFAFSDPGRATEKSWIIHEADLIVVGTLQPDVTLRLWFDGWHLSGTVGVEEVLFGPRTESRITYRYPGAYPWLQFWRPQQFPEEFLRKQLWFFKQSRDGWEPAAWYGCDSLSWRPQVEDYIRKYKLTSAR